MKKVGIITIIDFGNLGNRLQNYAVQEFLKKQGMDPYTILRDTRYPRNNIKWKLKNIFFMIYERCRIFRNCTINKKLIWHKMYKFTKKNINLSPYVIQGNQVPEKIDKEYEIFFTGSDQVWNPNTKNFSEVVFLSFANKKKRNSISASFGIEKIPAEKTLQFKKMLEEMNKISVRENRGQDLLMELCGKESTVLLDPTMFLTREEWLEIKSKKRFTNFPYVITLFLGKSTEAAYHDEIEDILKETQLRRISILDFANKKSEMVSPDEFITLIDGASLVLTDSFHGTVFSIIMKKPFVVFDRKEKTNSDKNNMKSRIETLLGKFKLENRTIELLKKSDKIFEIDYSNVDSILKKEKEKAIQFIREIIRDY